MAAPVWSSILGMHTRPFAGSLALSRPFSFGAVFSVARAANVTAIPISVATGDSGTVNIRSDNGVLHAAAGNSDIVGPKAVAGHIIHAHLSAPSSNDPTLWVNGWPYGVSANWDSGGDGSIELGADTLGGACQLVAAYVVAGDDGSDPVTVSDLFEAIMNSYDVQSAALQFAVDNDSADYYIWSCKRGNPRAQNTWTSAVTGSPTLSLQSDASLLIAMGLQNQPALWPGDQVT